MWGWDSEHLRLWVYLILTVHAREKPVMVGSVEVGYAQTLKSFRRIAEENQYIANRALKTWPTSRVHRMLKRFEGAGMVSVVGTDLGTLITVHNFRRFQDFDSYRSEPGTELGTHWERSGNNNNYSNSSNQLPLTGGIESASPRELDVFEYWRSRRAEVLGKTSGPPMRPTRKRTGKIRARLAEGYTVDELKHAVDGCLGNPFNLENGHTDVELICRDQNHVEQYLAWERRGAREQSHADDPARRRA